MITLRWRLVIAIACTLALTGIAWVWMAAGISYTAEDNILGARLKLAITNHQDSLNGELSNLASASYHDALIDIFADPNKRHPEQAAYLKTLKPGWYEWQNDEEHNPWPGNDILLAIIDDHNQRWWYRYDSTPLESNADENNRLVLFLITTFIGLTSCCTILGWLLSRWVTQPLQQLAQLVQDRQPDDTKELTKHFPQDEIGLLAQSFDRSHQRIQKFLQRERDFTRHASHELRTPLTVIEGALDLIALAPQRSEVALSRIRRATQDMRGQIHTFLTLARETSNHSLEQCSLNDIAERCIADHSRLANDLNIELSVTIASTVTISAPEFSISMIMDNLLRNAVQHRDQGPIIFSLADNKLEVRNQTDPQLVPSDPLAPGISGHNSTGHGLTIVARLCQHCDWDLDWQVEKHWFIVSIVFN